jgi:hypothetical protein
MARTDPSLIPAFVLTWGILRRKDPVMTEEAPPPLVAAISGAVTAARNSRTSSKEERELLDMLFGVGSDAGQPTTSSSPSTASRDFFLARFHEQIGADAARMGNHTHALICFRYAIICYENLRDSDPSNEMWRGRLAVNYLRVGDLIAKNKDQRERALLQYRRAISVTPTSREKKMIEAWLNEPRGIADRYLHITQYGLEGWDERITPVPKTQNLGYEANLCDARRLYAEARKRGYSVESAIEALERQAKSETTGRAEPRPKITGKSPRRRKRYVFTEQELHDPDTIDRAYDILADCEEKRRLGQPLSKAQVQDRRWADAFKRKLRKMNGPEVA